MIKIQYEQEGNMIAGVTYIQYANGSALLNAYDVGLQVEECTE